jgi:murein L,D-transpeptidase YafK
VRTFVCTALLFAFATIACASDPPPTIKADRVVVLKRERTLQLLNHGIVFKTYKVALGGNPVGPKVKQGDHRTPEGTYVLDRRNAHSQYYKSIHISYPSAADRVRAAKLHVSPGGDIFLHGLPNGYRWVGSQHRLRDWTDGCIAVTDEEIDEIWQLVPDGTPIEIKP